MAHFGRAPQVVPHAVPPPVLVPTQVGHPAEPLKLSKLKDAKAFIDNFEFIQYYIRVQLAVQMTLWSPTFPILNQVMCGKGSFASL
jgi:hypothetical protein